MLKESSVTGLEPRPSRMEVLNNGIQLFLYTQSRVKRRHFYCSGGYRDTGESHIFTMPYDTSQLHKQTLSAFYRSGPIYCPRIHRKFLNIHCFNINFHYISKESQMLLE